MSNNDERRGAGATDRAPPPAPAATSDLARSEAQSLADEATTRPEVEAARQEVDEARRHAEEAAAVAHEAEEVAERAARDVERLRRLSESRNVVDALQPGLALGGELTDAAGAIADSPAAHAAASGLRGIGAAIGAVREAAHVVERVSEAGSASRRLPAVEWQFTSAGTHHAWRMRQAEVRESLSQVTVTELELTCEHADADPALLLGRDATFTMSRDGRARRVQGVVSRVEALGVRDQKVHAKVTLVPALWALSQRRDSRVFEGKTVEQIIRTVVEAGLLPYRRSVRFAMQRTMPVREQCVQYRETDLDFVERIAAEEGISYVVVDGDAHEEVLFFDGAHAYAPFEGPDGRRIAVTGEDHDTHPHESLRRFESTAALTPTSASAMDFDWTHPDLRVAHENRSRDAAGVDREVYAHPADVTFDRYDAGDHAYARNDVQHRATLEAQRHLQSGRTFTGEGSVTGLRPGMLFTLEGHRGEGMEREYLVTSVLHRCAAPEETRDDDHARGHRAEEPYRNEVSCVASSVVVRPELRHRRQRIHGPQTARVVSAGGDEVETEHYGRVRVRFHWEREGRSPDDAQRAWVRVAQVWAGSGYGFVFVPRKDMEVVVQFIDGDPDRPLITGAVYNGTHPPPYDLERAESMTRSVIRTQSTPGGDAARYNELSFQDQSGREEVFVRAQRDLREEVLHDHATHVHAAQSNTVDATQTETIGVDQTLRVKRDRSGVIDRDDETLVRRNRAAKVLGDDLVQIVKTRTTRIGEGEERIVGGEGRETTVATREVLTVNGSQSVAVTNGDTLEVAGDKTDHVTGKYTVTADGQFRVTQGTVTLNIQNLVRLEASAHKVTFTNSSGTIELDDGKVTIHAADEIVLACGASSLSLKKNGTVALNGSREVGVGSGNSAVKASPAGVDVTGGTANITGSGMVNISGGVVKLN
jgi:type VI secretion system secreted protein VgrG